MSKGDPNWPRLSNMFGGPLHHPLECGKCLRQASELPVGKSLAVWEEHDHDDKPEHIYIVLCEPCSKKIVKPHPRLYSRKQQHEPMPGVMPTCHDCKLRNGLICKSPLLRKNGGAGLPLSYPDPARALVDGAHYRGPITLFTGPVTCKAKEPFGPQ